MQAGLRTFWLDDEVEEMQQATTAFLTDRYDNGSGAYVATTDDIAELEKATAEFLADRYDDECFCLDGRFGHGIMLPGEPFLLLPLTAVALARAGPATSEDFLGQVDELLLEQMDYEDSPGTVFLDSAFAAANVLEMEYTSFDDIIGANPLPNTPTIDGRMANEVHQILGICDDTDSGDSDDDANSSVGSDASAVVFDPESVLCHSEASYAASFFDAGTQSMVPYASLDAILSFDMQYGELSPTFQHWGGECFDNESEDPELQRRVED